MDRPIPSFLPAVERDQDEPDFYGRRQHQIVTKLDQMQLIFTI